MPARRWARTAAGVTTAILVSVVAAWVQVQALRPASDASDRLERTQLVRLAVERLRSAVRTAHADVNNYLLDGAESYLARFNESRQEAMRQMARLDDFSRGEPGLQVQLESLRPVVTAVFEVLAMAVQVPVERRVDEAVRLAGPGALRLLRDSTLIVDQLIEQVRDLSLELHPSVLPLDPWAPGIGVRHGLTRGLTRGLTPDRKWLPAGPADDL